MNRRICFLISLMLLSGISYEACAQKVERERRISLEKFPSASHIFLETEFRGRIKQKLYLETGSSGTAYEAKFRHNQRKYSVKFYENGQWLDTEKEIAEDELTTVVRKSILDHLSSGFGFTAFKMIRIQEQTSRDGLRYEIEVKGKSGRKTDLFEFLFDAGGKYLNHEVILIESFTNEF